MSIHNIHFIDVETVPQIDTRHSSSVHRSKLDDWDYYYNRFIKNKSEQIEDPLSHYNENAGLYAEHGKIVCISVGKIQANKKLYVKSFVGRDEKTILTLFAVAISQAISLCAHNGLDFDFPMLFRRYVINGLPVPAILNRINKKPWDPGLEDTMAMWSSSQWKYRCSLDLLTHVFGLPSPKEGMTGADVATVFYGMFEGGQADELPMDKEDRALNKIASYCSGDVVTMVDVYARMRGVESYTDIKILKHNNEPEPQEPQA